jgi:hypothetical protein
MLVVATLVAVVEEQVLLVVTVLPVQVVLV